MDKHTKNKFYKEKQKNLENFKKLKKLGNIRKMSEFGGHTFQICWTYLFSLNKCLALAFKNYAQTYVKVFGSLSNFAS